MERRYREGGMGYGEAKQALYEKMEAFFAPAREKRRHWLERPDDLEDVLSDGARRARESARPLLEQIRETVGLRSTPR